jgi:hypothetical protein
VHDPSFPRSDTADPRPVDDVVADQSRDAPRLGLDSNFNAVTARLRAAQAIVHATDTHVACFEQDVFREATVNALVATVTLT